MNYGKESHEINLKDMLFAVLYQWKKMILWALILAVALGGFKLYKAWTEATDEAKVAQYEQEYEVALDRYQQEKTRLEENIAKAEENIEKQNEYLENSVLMQMDSHEVYEARVSLYVSTDYQIMPEMVYQNPDKSRMILASYEAALTDNELMGEVADEMGMDTKYMKELVGVSGELDHILNISVHHATRTDAVKIMTLISNQLDAIQAQITESIGKHDLSIILNTVSSDINVEVADRQDEEKLRMEEYQTSLTDQQEQLSHMVEPRKTEISTEGAVKTGVKFAVVGGISGVVLVILVSCLLFVLSDKVYNGNELKVRFGIKILGGVAPSRKCCKVDRWLKRKEDRVTSNDEQVYELIAANIRNYSSGQTKLLVTGDAGVKPCEDLVSRVQEMLPGIQLTCCGSLLKDAESVSSLTGCDGVILVEQCRVSGYAHVAQEIERVLDAKKKLLGCVIVER